MACFRSKGTEGSSNSSSSEDLDSLLGANRAFSGVVIDPVPAGIRKSGNFDDVEFDNNVIDDNISDEAQHQHRNSPVKSRKSSLVHPRQPVIPLADIKITPDGNLAHQLECLADRAEAELKKLKNQQEEKDRQVATEAKPHVAASLLSADKR
jgi:hypothetical protein